jgi:ureidoacrylate peracid hydrolase
VCDPAYDATRTALLVVDPYNDFISEGGKLYQLSRETITSQDCVTHMREVLAAARAGRLLVCYAPHHRWRPGDYARNRARDRDRAASEHLHRLDRPLRRRARL